MSSVSSLKFLASALFAVTAFAGCSPHGGYGRSMTRAPGVPDGVQVVGRGKVDVSPDMARVHFGVVERGATANEASNRVQTKMQAVMRALKQAGVPSEQIQTRDLSVRENHEYRYRRMRAIEKGEQPPGLQKVPNDRYIANHAVELELTNLAGVSGVLASVQNAGVNEIGDIRFEVKNPEPFLEQARKKAIEDAQAQARSIAQNAGVRLGRLLYVSTVDDGGSPRYAVMGGMGARHKSMESSAVQAPIQPGQLTFEKQIFMRYEIGAPLARTAQPSPQK